MTGSYEDDGGTTAAVADALALAVVAVAGELTVTVGVMVLVAEGVGVAVTGVTGTIGGVGPSGSKPYGATSTVTEPEAEGVLVAVVGALSVACSVLCWRRWRSRGEFMMLISGEF